MKGDRIYVTGTGIVSALGTGVEENLSSLVSGISGIGRMRHLESVHNDLPVGEVRLDNAALCAILGREPDEKYTRTALLGAVALKEALESSGLPVEGTRGLALVSGTTVGGMDKSEMHYRAALDNAADADFIQRQDCGVTTEFAAGCFPCFDLVTTISTACSSAANAIMFAADLIRTGRCDIAVAGGSESLSKFHLNGFNSLMILDRENCRPFDDSRAGLNLGEGAAYLVLESETSVRRRKAAALCMLAGYGNACDAHHQTASSPDGEGAYLAMTKALRSAGLEPSDIDYVNAHGTGTRNNDQSEGIALERVFGKGHVPPVSSTKGMTGHTTSASGSIDAVIAILALLHDFLPVNYGFSTPMPSLSFVPVTGSMEHRPLENVLVNAFGFGGNDSSLIFSRKGI